MKLEKNRHRPLRILKASSVYFALIFGAGFVLGPIRILFIVPRTGVRIAELIEAPIMLLIIVFAARWLVRRFNLAPIALPVGFLALGFMIGFELTLVLWLRDLTLAEYFKERDPVAGFVYYLMLLVFAVTPLMLVSIALANEIGIVARDVPAYVAQFINPATPVVGRLSDGSTNVLRCTHRVPKRFLSSTTKKRRGNVDRAILRRDGKYSRRNSQGLFVQSWSNTVPHKLESLIEKKPAQIYAKTSLFSLSARHC